MKILKSVTVALKCGNHKGSPGVLINGTDTCDRQRSRKQRHGFVLFVSCVLSIVAIMFAVDLSTIGDNNSPHGSGPTAVQQVNDTSGLPTRQQTAITSQTIRAILTEANWMKCQSVYPSGSGKALLGKLARLELNNTSQAPSAPAVHIMTSLHTSHTSVRAPPHAI